MPTHSRLAAFLNLFRTDSLRRNRWTRRRSNVQQAGPAVTELLEKKALLTAIAWDGGGDGTSFADALNWSTDTVPGAADDVSIGAIDGNPFIVNLSANTTLNSLNIDSDDATLNLSGNRQLTLNADSAINDGTVNLSANSRILGTGTLTNDATIVVNGLNARITPANFIQNGDLSIGVAGGTLNVSLIVDSFTNHGSLNLGTSTNTASLSLNAGQALTNAVGGTVTVDSTATGDARILGDVINEGDFRVDGNLEQNEFGSSFSQNNGTLAVNGSMTMLRTTLNVNGGALAGANSPLVDSGTVSFANDVLNTFVVDTRGNSRIGSNLPADQTVKVIAGAVDGRLTTNNDFVNDGTILLQRDGASTRRLLIGTQTTAAATITNSANGTITVGEGGDFEITAGSLINEGTFTLNRDMLFRGARSITNSGTFTIGPNAEAGIVNSASQIPEFVQQDGELNVDGNLRFSSGKFTYTGGDIDTRDSISMAFGTLEVGAGNEGNFDVAATGTFRLIGNLQNNTQKLSINAVGAQAARLNVDSQFSNSGILTLGGADGATGQISLNVLTASGSGILTNQADGVIDINEGGAFQFIGGGIVNEGTLELDRDFDFRGAATITNRGTWTVGENSTMSTTAFVQIPEFIQQDGTLKADGTFRIQGARFTFEGGTIDPTTVVNMSGGTLTIANGNTNPIDVDATRSVRLIGNLANAAQSIEINAVGTTVGQLTVDDDFVNSGLITLGQSEGATAGVRLQPATTSVGSVITNGTDGVIDIRPGGSFDTQNNALLNEGTLILGRDFDFRGVRALTNRGDWRVEAGATLTLFSAFGQIPEFVQSDGSLQIDGDVEVRGAEFTFEGGNITGNIPVIQAGTLAIAENNDNAATFRVVNNGSSLTRSTLTTDLNENQTILLETQGAAASNSARLQVPDGFENNGTIRLAQEDGAAGTSLLVSSVFDGVMTNGQAGRIEGVGELEFTQLDNSGEIAPGNGIGLLAIDGDFKQNPTGSLEIELDGLTPQTEFDVLQINGDATIGGDLNLFPTPGLTPAIGTTFDIINYDSAVGDFSFVNGTDLGNNTLLEKSTNSAEVRLTVRIPPQLTVGDVTITESDTGTLDAVFTVTLEQTSNPVRVDFATSAGSANEAEDFIPVTGTLNFAANETEKTVTVPIVGDLRDEDPEVFEFVLGNPINAASFDPAGVGTILDNGDPQPEVSFSVDSQENPEATTPVLLNVELSRPSGVNVTVDFAVTGGSATGGGNDFTLANGTLSFAPDELSKPIPIDIINDLIVEANETIEITLSTPVRSTLGAITQHTVTIINDDAPIVISPVLDVTVNEDAADTLIDITDVFNSNEVPFSVTSSDDSLVAATLNGLDLTLAFAANQSGDAQITITAGEPGLQTTDTFNVTVNAVNDAPTVVTPIADATVNEDAADQVIDLAGVFEDIDSENVTLTAVSSDGTLVETNINGTDLTLAFIENANGAATVTVTANDGELTASDTFNVTVNAVNDAPTVVAPIADVTVNEDAADQVIDLAGVFEDIDSENLTLTAVSSDGTLVETNINGTNLTLAFIENANGAATITVTANDGELSASDTFNVTVNAVNDAPTVVAPIADVTVNEDAADQVIDLAGVFEDIDSENLTLTAVSSDGTLVETTINGTDLTLAFIENANGAATVTVTADDGELTASDTFNVIVNAVNDAPTVVTPIADATVNEDAADQVIDLAGVFEDIDSENLTLTAVSSDGTLVETTVNGTDLTLAFIENANGAATITVTANDGELSASDTFNVTVNAVNDAPTVVAPIADVTVNEDAADQVIDLAGVFEDIDSANLTLTAVSSDGTLVETTVNGTDLTLAFIKNANGAATVTVTADDGELTASDTFNVIVNAVNDAPTVAAPIVDVTVNEDAADQVIDLAGVFEDIDSENLTLTAVSSDGTLVETTVNGTNLTLAFIENANGAATITVTANDGELSASDTFNVTVNAVNDAPTVAAPIADVTVNEDAADQVIDLAGVFEDVDSENLTLTAVSSDGTLVETTVNGTDLTLAFIENANGAATITVTANDGELTASDTFNVTVNAVNDAPTVAAPIADVTVNEDAADQVIDLTGVFEDIDSENLTLTAVSSDGTLVETNINGTDLTLAFIENANGAATVTVTANDGELTASDTFNVTVNAVNDAPTVVAPIADVTVNEDAADQVIDLAGVFEDIDSENLTLTAVSSDGTLVETTVNGTDLTLAFIENANGAATVTVTANDGELTASDTFNVTVNAVNDDGTFGGDLSAEIDEGGSITGTATFVDAADGFSTLNFVLRTAAANGTASININGTWSYSPNVGFSGSDAFTIEVTDDGGNVETQTISITVNPNGEDDDAIRVQDGVLIIDGDQSATDENDRIDISIANDGILNVTVESGDQTTESFTFSIADINSIRITAGNGNDRITIADNILIPAEVDGGAGNDRIKTGGGDDTIVDMLGNNEIWSGAGADLVNTGDGHDWVNSGSGDDLVRTRGGCDVIYAGSGNDIVVSGAGRDWIFGERGRDILIGGDRADFIFGGSGQDILIGGWTSHDNNDEALNAIRDEWTSDRSIRKRVRNIWNGSGSANRANGNFFLNSSTISDDNDYDRLFGGYGVDWYPGC